MTQENLSRLAVILRYAGLSAQEKLEKDSGKRASIAKEKNELEAFLKMTPEAILIEAAKLTQR